MGNNELLKIDLCGRLTYGCKYKSIGEDYIWEYGDIDFDSIQNVLKHDNLMKPLLFPLSCLTKEITLKGETFVPMLKILELNGKPDRDIKRCKFDLAFIYEMGFSYGKSVNGEANTDWFISESIGKNVISLKNAELLNKWHIDYRGLIERGLAIDVTTLENNPYK